MKLLSPRQDNDDIVSVKDLVGPGLQSLGEYGQRFYEALTEIDTKPLDVVVLGHSITEGNAASINANRWLDILRTRMQRQYNPSGVIGGEGYVAATHKGTLPAQRWVHNGIPDSEGPTGTLGFGLGKHYVLLNESTDWAEVTVTCDRFWLLFTRGSSGRNAEILIDGSVVGTFDTYGTPLDTIKYDSGALTRGSHTIRVRPINTGSAGGSGYLVYLNGIMVFDGDGGASVDTGSGVRFWDSGVGGGRAAQFFGPGTGVEPGYWGQSLQYINPDLVIIQFGLNEYHDELNSVPGADENDLKTNMGLLLDFINAQVSVDPSYLIIIDAGTAAIAGFSEERWQVYAEKLREVSRERGCGLLDLTQVFPYPTGNTVIYPDAVHLSNGAHKTVARKILEGVTVDNSVAAQLITVKAADQTKASDTTLAADTHLGTTAIAASETWLIEYDLHVIGASDTGDIKIQITAPSGATGWWTGVGPGTAATGTGAASLRVNTLAFGDVQALGVTTTGWLIKVTVVVVNSTTAGNITFLWAQNTSSGSGTTIKAASIRRALKIS